MQGRGRKVKGGFKWRAGDRRLNRRGVGCSESRVGGETNTNLLGLESDEDGC